MVNANMYREHFNNKKKPYKKLFHYFVTLWLICTSTAEQQYVVYVERMSD